MVDSIYQSNEVQSRIEELKRQRKLTLPVGSSPEYYRLSAAIRYLTHGDKVREYSRTWKFKNASRLKYERIVKPGATPRILNEEQKLAAKEAQRKHALTNPQRKIRQRLERTLLYFYHDCASGKLGKKRRPKVESLLGCSPKQFREHMRSQLALKGWLWSEWRTKWTIDHVIPVRRFVLPKETRACYHHTNLRPLAKRLNYRGHKTRP